MDAMIDEESQSRMLLKIRRMYGTDSTCKETHKQRR
jgi:hypothetical protein